jgi:hypothetical protein
VHFEDVVSRLQMGGRTPEQLPLEALQAQPTSLQMVCVTYAVQSRAVPWQVAQSTAQLARRQESKAV